MSWKQTIHVYWTRAAERLDRINRALANQSVPNERRDRVGALALRHKATAAGQKLRSM
ncbi:hypothetical protein C8D92_101435 [Tamilnaduibacter salinus]|uniref:Uncharacterized protein n=1 Tax=Tamilnaduibacter salinus TaxID=1484056 RepID=A0A2U1D1F0_9GAMM|nr:hypothetical protein [Tamilnaduibacter salinus]PVY79225.1 hypothetical protein C8D92_101435 [Tamilnaduibacter salinus]